MSPVSPTSPTSPTARRVAAAALLSSAACMAACGAPVDVPDVVVYTSRQENLVKPLFDAWQQQTGQRIAVLSNKAAPLIAKLVAEGENTPADLLLTVDVGMLWHAAGQGVLRPLFDPAIDLAIPEQLRDPEGQWVGLSVRARAIVYAPERARAEQLSTYRALGDAPWRGRLCLRTGKSVYNRSLVAMLIARWGEAEAERVVRAWVANLAVPPLASDTQALQAVAAGQCDLTVVNSYYFGRWQRRQHDEPSVLAIFWPGQADGEAGVHINISGAGVTRYAPHPQAATELLRWLASPAAQAILAADNLEYPANPAAAIDPQLRTWGDFRPDPRRLVTAGRLQADAVRLMDRAGYR